MPRLKPLLVSIAGPTAVGKTALTIALAKHFDTCIISADSRQFYKEMTIGTAKPSLDELNEVKHYFINSHSITEDFSAGQFEKAALKQLDQLFESHNIVFLTGGSGLYINALLDGLPTMPKVNPDIRTQLNAELEDQGLTRLLDELKSKDESYYHQVDQSNPQRVIRALEVIRSTGKPFSFFRAAKSKDRPFKTLKIVLELPRELLYERINQRVDEMVALGLFDEVASLKSHRDKQALQTVGYKEAFDYLDGNIGKEEAIELIKQNTRRYAKRQLTWFRRDLGAHWFEPDQKADIISLINSEMKS